MFSPSQAAHRVPNTLLKVGGIGDLRLHANSLDAALFSMSHHDIYYTPKGRERPWVMPGRWSAPSTALKLGGVVVVQDNVAKAGSDPVDSVQKMHRIDPEAVKLFLSRLCDGLRCPRPKWP